MKKYIACQVIEVDGKQTLHYAFVADTREYFSPPTFGLRSDYPEVNTQLSYYDDKPQTQRPLILIDSILEVEDDIEVVDGHIYIGEELHKIKTEKQVNSRISTLQDYLNSTDWYAVRFADTGEPIPADIQEKRKLARIEISELRDSLKS